MNLQDWLIDRITPEHIQDVRYAVVRIALQTSPNLGDGTQCNWRTKSEVECCGHAALLDAILCICNHCRLVDGCIWALHYSIGGKSIRIGVDDYLRQDVESILSNTGVDYDE